ncbi:MAG: hypothetical protein WC310_00570 [Patescibacteria group bacterium]|jgi:hypothetical protein
MKVEFNFNTILTLVFVLIAIHFLLAFNSQTNRSKKSAAEKANPEKMINGYINFAANIDYCQPLYTNLYDNCPIGDFTRQSVDEIIALCEQESPVFSPLSRIYACADTTRNNCQAFIYCLANDW